MPAVWRLYYDSDCAFCMRMMRRACSWAESKGKPIEALPLNGPEAAAKGYGDALVLEADRIYHDGDAWLKLLTLAPWYLCGLSSFASTKPTRALVDGIYRVVAARRSCRPRSR